MRKFRSHKIVEAAEISGYQAIDYARGSRPVGDKSTVTVREADGSDFAVQVPENFFARGKPEIGDYFVRYDDGYVSWSPKKAFEGGYTAVED
jgi:hypothetical protein